MQPTSTTPDLLLDELPTVWEGRAIDPDFRHMVWLSNRIRRGIPEQENLDFVAELFRRFYREPVGWAELDAAYQGLCRFYAGIPDELGRGSEGSYTSGVLLYDYHCDAPYLVAAFQQAYGIDLTTAKLHWWRFRALFLALPEETLMSKIIGYRGVDLSRVDKYEREKYETLKEKFALPAELEGGKRIISVQDHEDAFFARFARD